MFDITGNDIADLNDTDLRTLVARLCEAELRRNKLSVSAVTAGGDQNAPDGGLDVRVELVSSHNGLDFIPRPNTGFQVKKPDMPRAAITKEIRPEGHVRPVIQELARTAGAYVIVSSSGSTADRSLQDRRAAMRSAVADIPNANNLHVDFYDRERVATWVRLYPGIASWVRERLGKPLQGWQAFGNWSAPGEPLESEYLLDGKCRLHDDRYPSEAGLTIEQGIDRIRTILSQPASAVRLIGLSGLGKTRLAQALFDERIGHNALAHFEVVYTDLATAPSPSPRDLIRHLVQSHQRAIVIVDNCPPGTHRALAQACSATDSQISLLTIEYDVGDDDPEGTEVFRLEAASNDIIEKLIERRMPHISQVDRQRIADFSGGNARIALAVARTIRRGESIAAFTDKDLFTRLFHQRHSENADLLRAAEACSLVYSFDGVTINGDEAELPIIAEIAGLTTDELYRHIRELKARDLLQQRSKMRAVLPHALANRLARHALDRLIPDKIKEIMVNRAPKRLLQSFSRRLGYLHDCETARKIVISWLSGDKGLAKISSQAPLGWSIFYNIAPVEPVVTLNVLNQELLGDGADIITDLKHPQRHRIATLLRSLAYDAASFHQSSMLLAKFVIAEPPDHKHNATSWVFNDLFHITLSGTNASATQRLEVIEALLRMDDAAAQECGLAALGEMLRTGHFSSSHNFEFGAHSRDFGWHPKTFGDLSDWYRTVINFMLELIISNSPFSERLCSMIASNFRWLWTESYIFDELELAVTTIIAQRFWADGWLSVKTALSLHSENMHKDILERLQAIEKILRPSQLLEEAHAYVLSENTGIFDLDITDDKEGDHQKKVQASYDRVQQRAEEIGRKVAANPEVLTALLPDLISGRDSGRRWPFGCGLADNASDIEAIWACLVQALAATPENERNIQVLRGILCRLADSSPNTANAFLDMAVSDPVLGPQFPVLQCSIAIDEKGVQRLFTAIQRGIAPVWTYGNLALGRATDSIPSCDLRRLLDLISAVPSGFSVAVEILYMKLFSVRQEAKAIDQDLIDCGRNLLLQSSFIKQQQQIDYRLADIAKACLIGADAVKFAEDLCSNLVEAFSDHRISIYDRGDLLKVLFKKQPITALTAFLTRGQNRNFALVARNLWANRRHPLDEVPWDELLAWANKDPLIRFPDLASVITLFVNNNDDGSGATTSDRGDVALSPKAIDLLNTAPDKEAILSCYEARLSPTQWSGSRADILEKRRLAIQELASHPAYAVSNWVKKWDDKLKEWTEKERAEERVRFRSTDESFE